MNSHHCLFCCSTSSKRRVLLITVLTSNRLRAKHSILWRFARRYFTSLCPDASSLLEQHKCHYTLVPALEDNSDNSESQFVGPPWLVLHHLQCNPSILSYFWAGSLPAGLFLNIWSPKPQQLKRSVAKSPRHKFTENVRLWCVIQLHCNLSLPLGSGGQGMMQDVSIKCLTFLCAIKHPKGVCTNARGAP